MSELFGPLNQDGTNEILQGLREDMWRGQDIGRAIAQAKAEGRAEAFRECAEEAREWLEAVIVSKASEAEIRCWRKHAGWCEAQAKAQEPPK